MFEGGRTGSLDPVVIVAIVAMALVLVIVHLLHGAGAAARADPISQAPDRARPDPAGALAFALKVNTAGVIPPIFASSLLLMPLTVLQMAVRRRCGGGGGNEWLISVSTYLQHGSPLYLFLYGAGVVFFCFFYTAVSSTRRKPPSSSSATAASFPDPSRQGDRDLFRLSAQPHHRGRRGLSRAHLSDP